MTHLTRETHRPNSQYTGGPLFILHLHTRAANSQDTIDQRVLMLGRCDGTGCASPWLPAPQTFPRRERTETAQAPFSFPDTQKEYRQEGVGFHIPLSLRILLNPPTQAPFPAWVTQFLPHTPAPRAFGDDVTAWGGLCHQCHEQLSGGTSPLSQLKPAPRVSCSEVSQQLVFCPGD